jgi:hypothetical protein
MLLILLQIAYVPVMIYFYLKKDYLRYNFISKYFQFIFVNLILVLAYLYLFVYIKLDLKREIAKIVKAMNQADPNLVLA